MIQEHKQKVKEPVIVLAHHDGWIEVYGHVHVQFLNVPHIPPATDRYFNSKHELLIEEYLLDRLGKSHVKIFFPGLLASSGQVQWVRPSDLMHRNVMSELMRCSV